MAGGEDGLFDGMEGGGGRGDGARIPYAMASGPDMNTSNERTTSKNNGN